MTSHKDIKSKPSSKKKTRVAASSLQTLQKVRNTRVQEYTTVKNTDKAYRGHLARGKKWLEDVVVQRVELNEVICCEGIPTAELAKAFDKPPNQFSAVALEMFLVEKCFTQNCGKDTADGIHGAFAAYWDTMEGDKYAGSYSLDEDTGKIHGCPARAPAITAVIHAIKTRALLKGAAATRNHAEAMTLEDIQKLVRWSEKECPDEMLTMPIDNVENLNFCLEHALIRAFASSAFTLWTRCFELLSLQVKDIQEGCFGPAPYYIPHFKVKLENRKGWQKLQGYEGPRTSNIYDIYEQDIPEIDMSKHLPKWRSFLQRIQPDRAAESEDCIFPHVSSNGLVHWQREMSYDTLSALLKKFSAAAGLDKSYTTHSFRRGGAQYRFMFAPLGKRWSLARIRWWGGWAIGEHVDTLIKYLVDSLQSYETGHGNALHPLPIDASGYFMGDDQAVKPATAEEIRQMSRAVDRKLNTFIGTITTSLKQPKSSSPPAASRLTYATPLPSNFEAASDNNDATYSDHNALSQPYEPISNPISFSLKHSPSPPPFGIYIPDLGRSSGAWRRAIDQWLNVDPITKLALKDWPAEWYTGPMRTVTASKRGQRQTIYNEYRRLGCNDDVFLHEYPSANRSIRHLLADIRKKNMKVRNSKHGMPEQRRSQS